MEKNKTEEELILEAKREYSRENYRKNRKKRQEYQRKWREANPEKVAEANRRYWSKKAQERRA